jgi:hypothetical protein
VSQWSNIAGQPNAPANNATVGATWGTNIGNQPSTLAGINSGEGEKLSIIDRGASLGDNLVQNAGLELSSAGWFFPVGITRAAATLGGSSPFVVRTTAGNTSTFYNNTTSPVTGGKKVYNSVQIVTSVAGVGGALYVQQFNNAGTNILTTNNGGGTFALGINVIEYAVTLEPSCAAIRVLYEISVYAGGSVTEIGSFRTAYGQFGADVTANSVPIMMLPASPTIKANYLGAVLAGQLPRDLLAKRTLGDVDVTTTTAWSIVATGCTATIGAATGVINITACASTGKIVVTSVRGGISLSAEFSVFKDIAAPPSTGGGGSGGGSGSASTSSIGSVTASTYSGVQAGPLTVQAGTAGTVNLSAPLTFSSSTGGGARGKWQWRIVGGSFADVSSEDNSSSNAIFGEPDSGYIEATDAKTGLTSGTSYEFQLQLRRSTGSATMSFSGTASAVAA